MRKTDFFFILDDEKAANGRLGISLAPQPNSECGSDCKEDIELEIIVKKIRGKVFEYIF